MSKSSHISRWLSAFCNRITSGDSVLVFIVMIVVSALILWFLTSKETIIREWAYEPIVSIPPNYQNVPFVRKWFHITRGGYYVTVKYEDQSIGDFLKKPKTAANIDTLFSGWAFLHCLQHFLLAFLCPKLVYLNIIVGIIWEIMEAVFYSHCTLDIFWNMCGTLVGLLLRQVVF